MQSQKDRTRFFKIDGFEVVTIFDFCNTIPFCIKVILPVDLAFLIRDRPGNMMDGTDTPNDQVSVALLVGESRVSLVRQSPIVGLILSPLQLAALDHGSTS